MDNTDYIESYFTKELLPDQSREFEKRIESDPVFADEVAFYLSALTVSKELAHDEKKEHFKTLYEENSIRSQIPVRNISAKHPFRKLIYYIAAAALVAGIIFGTYTFTNTVSAQELARNYETEELQKLGVTMGGSPDINQEGLNLYNDGKYAEALSYFETIIRSDSANSTAKQNAGLSALRLKRYDEALNWFKKLETYNKLYSNPAIFYQALTLMDRNQPGDDTQAKQLLEQIVQNNLDKKEVAEKWLKRIK
ncbi:MAG TPA: tetratricopeptide repeat protein [Puia sp.]|nr:tetratricopeptide repeat protein [Puia sp.]